MSVTGRNRENLSQGGRASLDSCNTACCADNNDGNESDEEHQRTQYAKEVHRLDAEGGKEPEGYQVQVSVEETIPPAEFVLPNFRA